jgi:hypothetical protein
VEEEFFIGKNSGRFEQNWLTVGLQWETTDELRLKAGYRGIALYRGGAWENRNMLVTGIHLYF